MKFYDKNTRGTINDEINRICGVNDAVYSLVDKLARVDNALDDYWKLANDAAPILGFDDSGNSSLPVETQNLVSGTNAYQVKNFTNNILQLLRISILTDDAVEGDLIREYFDNLDEFAELYKTTITGTPAYWTKMGDFIYLRPTPNYNETNGLRAYASRELSKFTPVIFTTTHASELINATAHGLSNGDTIIMLTNNTLPSGYSEDTVYYVVNKADNTFQVAAAGGGSAVSITNDGTGTHKFIHLSKSPGIPVVHHKYLARKAAIEFMDGSHHGFNKTLRQIAIDEINISEYWQNMDRTIKIILGVQSPVFK